MKAFIAICLFAVACAEPEADPALLYSTAGYASPYAYNYAPFAYSGYHGFPYAAGYAGAYAAGAYASPYYYGARLLKREAEAEPEADPALLYAGAYGAYGFPYAARAYTYGAYPYASAYGYPYAHAVAAPAAVHAVAAPAAVPAVPGAYAAAGRYVANSAGVVHVAKREAEAEADPALLYSSAFGYPYASTYGAYAYGAYPYASTYAYSTPYAYGAYPYGRYFY